MNTWGTVLQHVKKIAKERYGASKAYRKGQALMCALYDIRKEWYLEISRSHNHADCFYDDKKIPAFEEWVTRKDEALNEVQSESKE